MMHEPVQRFVLAAPDGHFQSVEGEAGPHIGVEPPPDDFPGVHIGHERRVHHSVPGRNVGYVGDPQSVRPVRGELQVHQVLRSRSAWVDAGRAGPAAAQRADQPRVAHQTLDRAARHRDPFPVELTPHLPCPVHLVVLLPHASDFHEEFGVALRTGRRRPVFRGIVG